MGRDRCPYEEHPGTLLDHLEGVLPERESQALTRHLAECDRCVRELDGYAEILALARSGPQPAAPPGTEARLRAAIRRELAGDFEKAGARATRTAWSWSRLVPRARGLAVGLPALAALVLFVVMRAGQAPLMPSSASRDDAGTPVVATAPSESGTAPVTPEPAAGTPSPITAAKDTEPVNGTERVADQHEVADVAMDPALEGEIASYEGDHLREYGAGDAAESLSADETQAFTTLLDQELEALMRKHGNPGDQSNLGRPAEEMS